jgi:hypothetical protein
MQVCIPLYHVRWVPCHHSMACPQVAVGGIGFELWSIAVNVLNMLQTANKGLSTSSGLTISHYEK